MESHGFNQSPGSVYQHGMGEVLRKGVTHLVIAATPGMCHCPDAPSTKSGIMLNVYDFMKELPPGKRLVVNDLLFCRIQMPVERNPVRHVDPSQLLRLCHQGKEEMVCGRAARLSAGKCVNVANGLGG